VLDLETYRLRASSVYSESTVRHRVYVLRGYGRFLEERGMEPGVESLMAWLDELQRRGTPQGTLAVYAYAVLSYFDLMLVKVDERSLKVVRRRARLPPPSGAEYLTEEEVRRLIEAAPPRRKLIYAFMYSYSRRLGEVLHLTWRDVDLERGTVAFRILKKRQEEVAVYPLEPWIREMLSRYRSELGEDRLFPVTKQAVEKGFKRDCEAAGIEPKGRRLRPHLFRHARVTHLRARGVPLDVVSKWLLRHSKYDITLGYYRAVTEEEVEKVPQAWEVLYGGA
jgi:integrase